MAEAHGPHQPRQFAFPVRAFGSKGEKRSFKPAWFDEWSWLHYRELTDSVVCYYSSQASEKNLLPQSLFKKTNIYMYNKGFYYALGKA